MDTSLRLVHLAEHRATESARRENVMTAHDRSPKPEVRKLGTIDCDMVETTPIVFGGRLYRFEYVRTNYRRNDLGESYHRLVDVETGEPTSPFAVGWDAGSAHVENDTAYAFAVDRWGGAHLDVFHSHDLREWSHHAAIHQPEWGMYNNSVCRADDRYVMAIELGEPPEEVGERFTMRFAESDDLLDWRILPPDRVFAKDRYTACPAVRYLDGFVYMIYLERRPGRTYEPHIVRSTDLIEWESSPHSPVLSHGPEDKEIAETSLDPQERRRIASALDRNNSDVDLCEHEGRTILYYSWGNQKGTEFLAEAQYDGPLADFLRAFFPAGSS